MSTVITRHSTMGEVDPSVSRYEVARDFGGGASLRPLRSAVSGTEGCQSSEGAR